MGTARIPPQLMTVGPLQIEYQVSDYTPPWAESEPETILFHHGYCRHMDLWRGWVPQLARDYRVLRFNSRGCGHTTAPAPGTSYSVHDLVGDALGLLDALGIERVHWVAESSGGIVGLAAALSHPDRLHSLTLCNTPFKLPDAVAETYNVGESDHAAAIEKYGVGGWSRKTLGYRIDLTKATPEMQDWYIRIMDSVPKHVAIAHHQMVVGGDLWPRLSEIRLPTLIMIGENSRIARKDQMEKMQARMPNAHLVVFKGYGNGIASLAPERCVAELRGFLEKDPAD